MANNQMPGLWVGLGVSGLFLVGATLLLLRGFTGATHWAGSGFNDTALGLLLLVAGLAGLWMTNQPGVIKTISNIANRRRPSSAHAREIDSEAKKRLQEAMELSAPKRSRSREEWSQD